MKKKKDKIIKTIRRKVNVPFYIIKETLKEVRQEEERKKEVE